MSEEAKSINSEWSAQSAPNGKNGKTKTNGKNTNNGKHLGVADIGKPLPSSGDESAIDNSDNISTHSYDSNQSGRKSNKKKSKAPSAEGAYAKLSKQERREFRMAFRLFDKDDDGQISVQELKQVFEGLNYHFTELQLVNMLKSIDDNGDGKVDIDEFVCVMKGSAYSDTSNNRPYVEELRDAFEVFDKDGDGQITPQELSSVMNALGEKLSEQDIMTMIQEADADGDGNIDFEEFKQLMEQDQILGFDKLKDAKSGGSTSGGSTTNNDDDDEKQREKVVRSKKKSKRKKKSTKGSGQ